MMLFPDRLVVVRGGGDLATGAVARLHRAGFPVIVFEIDPPLAVRRTVAVAAAVTDGEVRVEDLLARRVADVDEALSFAGSGIIPVLVEADLPDLPHGVEIVVDARVAKRNIDTRPDDAPLVIGLGPGFTAGVDCHAIVETMRGPYLGRVLWTGSAMPNTGIPGWIGGEDEQRVLRAETSGPVDWDVDIGDHVVRHQSIGRVGDTPVRALTAGVVRGLITPGFPATPGLKLGDIDPRAERAACFEISDKALAVGGGVVEAALIHLNRVA
jgi:xanthine dehydrogenase accessory factor